MRIAVVLFNLGGPDSAAAVKPFLFNLFNDAAIIRLPAPLRYVIAKIISSKRAPTTQEIYKQIGNKSPLLELTTAQADALKSSLNASGDNEYETFIAMRYWHPRANDVAKKIKKFAPDKIILLPLYPQFSTTTTASSIKEFESELKRQKVTAKKVAIGCYPYEPSFIEAHADLLVKTLQKLPANSPYRILFSAHGLPKKIVDAGDPYQWQVEQTVSKTVSLLQQKLMQEDQREALDYSICYQSRVGPLEWIGPSTEAEIARAGQDQKAIVLTPIAFVSEHSETLVELDIEYRHLAEKSGVNQYFRVPALGTHAAFIQSLTNLCYAATESENKAIISHEGNRICPQKFGDCACYGLFKKNTG